jgi:hypothetical protein
MYVSRMRSHHGDRSAGSGVAAPRQSKSWQKPARGNVYEYVQGFERRAPVHCVRLMRAMPWRVVREPLVDRSIHQSISGSRSYYEDMGGHKIPRLCTIFEQRQLYDQFDHEETGDRTQYVILRELCRSKATVDMLWDPALYRSRETKMWEQLFLQLKNAYKDYDSHSEESLPPAMQWRISVKLIENAGGCFYEDSSPEKRFAERAARQPWMTSKWMPTQQLSHIRRLEQMRLESGKGTGVRVTLQYVLVLVNYVQPLSKNSLSRDDGSRDWNALGLNDEEVKIVQNVQIAVTEVPPPPPFGNGAVDFEKFKAELAIAAANLKLKRLSNRSKLINGPTFTTLSEYLDVAGSHAVEEETKKVDNYLAILAALKKQKEKNDKAREQRRKDKEAREQKRKEDEAAAAAKKEQQEVEQRRKAEEKRKKLQEKGALLAERKREEQRRKDAQEQRLRELEAKKREQEHRDAAAAAALAELKIKEEKERKEQEARERMEIEEQAAELERIKQIEQEREEERIRQEQEEERIRQELEEQARRNAEAAAAAERKRKEDEKRAAADAAAKAAEQKRKEDEKNAAAQAALFSLSAAPSISEAPSDVVPSALSSVSSNTAADATPPVPALVDLFEGPIDRWVELVRRAKNDPAPNINDNMPSSPEFASIRAQEMLGALNSQILDERLSKAPLFGRVYNAVHPKNGVKWKLSTVAQQVDEFAARLPYLLTGMADNVRKYLTDPVKHSTRGNTGGLGFSPQQVHVCPVAFDVTYATFLSTYVVRPLMRGICNAINDDEDIGELNIKKLMQYRNGIENSSDPDIVSRLYLTQLGTEASAVVGNMGELQNDISYGICVNTQQLHEMVEKAARDLNGVNSTVLENGTTIMDSLMTHPLPFDHRVAPETLLTAFSVHQEMFKKQYRDEVINGRPISYKLFRDLGMGENITDEQRKEQKLIELFRKSARECVALSMKTGEKSQSKPGEFGNGMMAQWINESFYERITTFFSRTTKNDMKKIAKYQQQLVDVQHLPEFVQEKADNKQLCYTLAVLECVVFELQPSRLTTIIKTFFDDSRYGDLVANLANALQNASQTSTLDVYDKRSIVDSAAKLQTVLTGRKYILQILRAQYVIRGILSTLIRFILLGNAPKNDILFSYPLAQHLEQARIMYERNAFMIMNNKVPKEKIWQDSRIALDFSQAIMCLAEAKRVDDSYLDVIDLFKNAGARELMQGLWNVSKIFPTINFTLDREKVEKEMGAILRVDWTAVESTEKNLFDPRENGYQYVLSSENF